MDKPKLDDFIRGTLASVLILLLSTLIGNALSLVKTEYVLIGVGVFIIITLGTIGIVWTLGREGHNNDLRKIVRKLDEIVPSPPYSWLYTNPQIDEIESSVKCKEIWVISPDLTNDTGSPTDDISSIIKKNLSKGITYTYIVPDIPQINTVLPHLRRVFASRPAQLVLVKLPKETFRSLTLTHFVVYYPNMDDGNLPQLYWALPLNNRGSGKDYWVRVADDLTREIVGTFRELIENNSVK